MARTEKNEGVSHTGDSSQDLVESREVEVAPQLVEIGRPELAGRLSLPPLRLGQGPLSIAQDERLHLCRVCGVRFRDQGSGFRV